MVPGELHLLSLQSKLGHFAAAYAHGSSTSCTTTSTSTARFTASLRTEGPDAVVLVVVEGPAHLLHLQPLMCQSWPSVAAAQKRPRGRGAPPFRSRRAKQPPCRSPSSEVKGMSCSTLLVQFAKPPPKPRTIISFFATRASGLGQLVEESFSTVVQVLRHDGRQRLLSVQELEEQVLDVQLKAMRRNVADQLLEGKCRAPHKRVSDPHFDLLANLRRQLLHELCPSGIHGPHCLCAFWQAGARPMPEKICFRRPGFSAGSWASVSSWLRPAFRPAHGPPSPSAPGPQPASPSPSAPGPQPAFRPAPPSAPKPPQEPPGRQSSATPPGPGRLSG